MVHHLEESQVEAVLDSELSLREEFRSVQDHRYPSPHFFSEHIGV